MELRCGINTPGLQRNKHCLRIVQNVYDTVDAERTWYLYLNKKSDQDIDQALKDLSATFEGTFEDHLGAKITKQSDDSLLLNQPQFIGSILQDLNLIDEHGNIRPGAKSKDNPSQTTTLLGHDLQGAPLDADYDYLSMIGKLNHLYQTTRGELGHQVSQLSRFLSDPKASHGAAVKQIGRYLLGARAKGVILLTHMCDLAKFRRFRITIPGLQSLTPTRQGSVGEMRASTEYKTLFSVIVTFSRSTPAMVHLVLTSQA